jgi:hypothetical protein
MLPTRNLQLEVHAAASAASAAEASAARAREEHLAAQKLLHVHHLPSSPLPF